MSLSCNIDVAGVELSVKNNQHVTATVPKHTLWNCGPALLPTLDFDPKKAAQLSRQQLPILLEGDHGLVNRMFMAPEEQLLGAMGKIRKDMSCSLRDYIRFMWKTACEEPQV